MAFVQQYPTNKDLYGQYRIKVGVMPEITSLTSVFQEEPTGLKNDSNKTFNLKFTPYPQSESVYKDGMYMRNGAAHDYVISGKQLMFAEAPSADAVILINYKYAGGA